MKMLLSAAQTLPLHVGRVGERAPPLCGAVPADSGHVARAGDAVAALVRVSEKEENWILAEVVIHIWNLQYCIDCCLNGIFYIVLKSF